MSNNLFFSAVDCETIAPYLGDIKIEKGTLSIGRDADFCIVDLNKPWIVKQENLHSKSKNTSIENKKLQGKVINTFVKGEELFKL